MSTPWYDETPPIEHLSDEQWRPVPALPRFFSVSNYGRLFSYLSGQLIKPHPNNREQRQVYLRGRTYHLARIVSEAFGQPKPASGSWYIKHRDNDHGNCALANLEWRPRAELNRGRNKPRTKCSKGHELSEHQGKRRCYTCRPLPEVIVESAVEL